MQGLDVMHASTRETADKLLRLVYGPQLYDPGQMEDVILMTRRRSEFPNIGTDKINMRTMMYIIENIYWMNVCLYVNEDFRSCFDDAVMIEKALLRVNDQEYQDFRDDMTLEESEPQAGSGGGAIPIDFMSYSEQLAGAIASRVDKAKVEFYNAGMTDVYNDLTNSFDPKTKASVSYVIHNMMYVVNAMNRNGVFKKYVTLVVDSVKAQLS